jgi:hypothetical protein
MHAHASSLLAVGKSPAFRNWCFGSPQHTQRLLASEHPFYPWRLQRSKSNTVMGFDISQWSIK